MDNLEIYNKLRVVPSEAKKTIGAGRLKGMTDINPMWRIKALTEQFGACGIGWYYEVVNQWIDEVGDERVANVSINLFIKVDGEWSKPIYGIGGSKLSTMESKGVYVSDEAYKMATTDAISVSCKQLGVGADVYWDKDRTKYSSNDNTKASSETVLKSEEEAKELCSEAQVGFIEKLVKEKGVNREEYLKMLNKKSFSELTKAQATAIINKMKG